ncbi:MAG: preprotein translocase subunit SecE [Bacteroidota bacterium]|nr:preprotein translocase subunit SecE [Bacteroidota bacterium]
MTKIISFIGDSFSELKTNVTWPTWSEAQRLTVVVAIFSVLFALLTWGADELLTKVIEGFYSLVS